MKKLLFLFILLVSGLTFSQTKNISETKGSNNQQSRIEDPLIDDPNEGDPIELEPEADPITTLSPSIETSEVGNTNGELSVSGTGGAVYNIPIAFEFPAGHQKDNRTLILGKQVDFEVNEKEVKLIFD